MDLPNQAEKIVVTRRDGEICEYTFLTCLNSNEELDELRFEHNCRYHASVKNRPNFDFVTMHCQHRRRGSKCQYSLFARRLNGNDNSRIGVYAYSEHNHPVKPVEKRNAYREKTLQLVDDDESPKNELQCGAKKWKFLKILDNFEHLDRERLENHCTTHGKQWNSEAIQMTICCTRHGTCPFQMLIRKTTKGRYHVYTLGEHNHGKEVNDSNSEEQNFQYTIENIRNGLRKALLDRNGQEVGKWVGRTGKRQIKEVVGGLDGMEVVMLLKFFEQADLEDLRSNLLNCLDWIDIAIENRAAELVESSDLKDRLIAFSQWLNSIILSNEQGNVLIVVKKEEFPMDKIKQHIEKNIQERNEDKIWKWMRRTKSEWIETLLSELDEHNRKIVIYALISAIGKNKSENNLILTWILAILGGKRLKKMVNSEEESVLLEWFGGQTQAEAVLLRTKLRLDKMLKMDQRKRKLDGKGESEIDPKKIR